MNALTPISSDAAIRGNYEAELCMETDGLAVTDALARFDVQCAEYARESHPDGPSRGSYTECVAELVSLHLGGAWVTRTGAVDIFGEDEVRRVEREAEKAREADE